MSSTQNKPAIHQNDPKQTIDNKQLHQTPNQGGPSNVKPGQVDPKSSENYQGKPGKEKKVQTIKEEIQLQEDKLKNNQTKVISIKEENDSLREQLKELCNYLSKELEKKKLTKTNPTTEIEDPQKLKLFLEKTIENNDKQLKYYKTLVDKMQAKDEKTAPPPQRIETLVNKIKEVEDDISTISIKVKELEGANKILEKEEFQAKEATDFMKNLSLLTTEINALRGKSEKLKRNLQINEKNFKMQQEFLTKLETKYIELCKNLQINPELSKIKLEIEDINKKNLIELQKFNQEIKKLKGNRKNSNKEAPKFMLDDLIRLKTEPVVKKKRYASVKEYREEQDDINENFDLKEPAKAERAYNNLRSRIKTIKKIIANEEKTLMKSLEDYQTQIVELESENRDIDNRLKERDKEIIMVNEKFKDIKKNTKFNALAPLNSSMFQTNKENPKEKELKEREDFTNKSLIIQNTESRKRHAKRDSCGAILSYDVVFFDDVQIIGACKKHLLKQITFYLDKNNLIVGLQASYIKHGEVITGLKNIMASTLLENNGLKEIIFELAEDDYIRNIYGLYLDWIEYLRFETEKGKIFEVGSINDKETPKEFTLNIRNFDIPVTVFGALDIKKGSDKNEYVLAAIGVEMINELSVKNEARNKDLLTKSLIAKDILNLSGSSAGGGSSLERQKKKRYYLKKPDDLIREESSGKKKRKPTHEKSLSLEKKKSNKKAVRMSDNDSDDDKKSPTPKVNRKSTKEASQKIDSDDDKKIPKLNKKTTKEASKQSLGSDDDNKNKNIKGNRKSTKEAIQKVKANDSDDDNKKNQNGKKGTGNNKDAGSKKKIDLNDSDDDNKGTKKNQNLKEKGPQKNKKDLLDGDNEKKDKSVKATKKK